MQQDTWSGVLTIKLSVIRLSVLSYSQKTFSKQKKIHVSAGEMYVMICVEFADEHFGVGLMYAKSLNSTHR